MISRSYRLVASEGLYGVALYEGEERKRWALKPQHDVVRASNLATIATLAACMIGSSGDIRAVKEKAWDEGYVAALNLISVDDMASVDLNPYRRAS